MEQRMVEKAGPLDVRTLKRAELAEHLMSSATRGAKAMSMAQFGDRAAAEAELESIKAGHATSVRLLTELAGLGDPIASAALSAASHKDERMMRKTGSMFLEDGFLIETHIGFMKMPDGIALIQTSAYGIVFDRCDAGGAAYRVGAMLQNSNPTAWKAAEGGLMVDVFHPLMLAMLKADAYNSIPSGPYGTEAGMEGVRFSAADLAQLRRSDSDPAYIARLLSAGGREGLELALKALYLRFDYMRMRKHHSQDDSAYVMSLTNSMIRDEMVRGCAKLNDMHRHVEHAVSMAYGDTVRALALMGRDVLKDLDGADLAAAQSYLMAIGSLTTGLALTSPIAYLATLCCLDEEEVRRRARKVIAKAAGRIPGLRKTIDEISELEEKRFIHKGNLATALAAYAARRENDERASEATPTQRSGNPESRLQ
jgi:hypothetical protein